jgi:glycyl-tRNA synthetase (class II)
MSPLLIAQLVLQLGPIGLELAQKLAAVWSKPSLTPDEVMNICNPVLKSYDAYIQAAKESAPK